MLETWPVVGVRNAPLNSPSVINKHAAMQPKVRQSRAIGLLGRRVNIGCSPCHDSMAKVISGASEKEYCTKFIRRGTKPACFAYGVAI